MFLPPLESTSSLQPDTAIPSFQNLLSRLPELYQFVIAHPELVFSCIVLGALIVSVNKALGEHNQKQIGKDKQTSRRTFPAAP